MMMMMWAGFSLHRPHLITLNYIHTLSQINLLH